MNATQDPTTDAVDLTRHGSAQRMLEALGALAPATPNRQAPPAEEGDPLELAFLLDELAIYAHAGDEEARADLDRIEVMIATAIEQVRERHP